LAGTPDIGAYSDSQVCSSKLNAFIIYCCLQSKIFAKILICVIIYTVSIFLVYCSILR
jgi:hypothetical protein